MPMIFNIHTPTHSFALPFRAGENADALLDRILRKAGFAQTTDQEKQDFKKGKGGAGVRYEFEGGRWTLADGEWQARMRGVNRASERNEDVGGRDGRDDVKSSATTLRARPRLGQNQCLMPEATSLQDSVEDTGRGSVLYLLEGDLVQFS
jgi:hypothetical protein